MYGAFKNEYYYFKSIMNALQRILSYEDDDLSFNEDDKNEIDSSASNSSEMSIAASCRRLVHRSSIICSDGKV